MEWAIEKYAAVFVSLAALALAVGVRPKEPRDSVVFGRFRDISAPYGLRAVHSGLGRRRRADRILRAIS